MTDDHIQHTWQLTHTVTRDEITIDLWTDDYTVAIDGGPNDGDQRDGGRTDINHLLAKYQATGYQLIRDYQVNDPTDMTAELVDDEVLHDKPERCPECGSTTLDHASNHVADHRQGDAWLCTNCNWGEWITA